MDHIFNTILLFTTTFQDGTAQSFVLGFNTIAECFDKLKEVLQITEVQGHAVHISNAACYAVLNPS